MAGRKNNTRLITIIHSELARMELSRACAIVQPSVVGSSL
jgi:hypothetical protein